jgi:hypothetical protein
MSAASSSSSSSASQEHSSPPPPTEPRVARVVPADTNTAAAAAAAAAVVPAAVPAAAAVVPTAVPTAAAHSLKRVASNAAAAAAESSEESSSSSEASSSSDGDSSDGEATAPPAKKGKKGPSSGALAAKKGAVRGQFFASPKDAADQVFLPAGLCKAVYAQEDNVPTVHVDFKPHSAQACAAAVWTSIVRRLRMLLHWPKTQPRPSTLGNVLPLSAATSPVAKEAVKIAYNIPNNVDATGIDMGKIDVYCVSWPSQDSFPCDPDTAYIVIDESGTGGGVALVYKHAALFVQGPDASEGRPLARKSAVGEMVGFTPAAACLLHMFCAVVSRASASAKGTVDKRLFFDVLISTDAGTRNSAQQVYRDAAAAFTSRITDKLFITQNKAQAAARAMPPAKAMAAKEKLAAARVSAAAVPAARPSSMGLVPRAAAVAASAAVVYEDDGDDDDLDEALASLCDLVRRKNLPSGTICAQASLLAHSSAAPPPATAKVYGTPGGVASLEHALRTLTAVILHFHWSTGLVYKLENQMMQMQASRL